MLRLILLLIVGLFVAVGVLAVALYHFLGVRGLIIFPFVILAFLWVAKWVIKNLVKKFALSLFGRKARALRGATMNVHSIKVIPEPPEPKSEDEDEDETPPSIGHGVAGENAELGEKSAVSIGKKDPRDYVELDVTITPKPASCNAFTFWEPTEFILASEKIRNLADLEEKSIGDVHSVEVWNGSAFGSDDQGKYPGEQRLKVIFEVKPGSKSGWLCYYHEAIGQLQLPVGTVEV
jgi:hypothetical protein